MCDIHVCAYTRTRIHIVYAPQVEYWSDGSTVSARLQSYLEREPWASGTGILCMHTCVHCILCDKARPLYDKLQAYVWQDALMRDTTHHALSGRLVHFAWFKCIREMSVGMSKFLRLKEQENRISVNMYSHQGQAKTHLHPLLPLSMPRRTCLHTRDNHIHSSNARGRFIRKSDATHLYLWHYSCLHVTSLIHRWTK